MLEVPPPLPPLLREAAKRHTLSHALLFTGPGDREAAALWTAAAMECQEEDPPCGHCAACRKVLDRVHPDVITVRDDEHEKISVEVIRESVRSDAYVRPNEGARKIYIFPDCALLSEADQNVLLKIVEEGPPYAAFLFCAENPSSVLRTLRSRCVEVKLPPVREEESGAGARLGEALCRSMGQKGAPAEFLFRLEARKTKPTREDLTEMLAWSREAFTAGLRLAYGCGAEDGKREIASFLSKTLTKGQMMSTIEVLETYHGQCAAYNVGVGHVLGALAAELEGIL